MEIFNVTGVIIIAAIALVLGMIIGGTYAEYRHAKKEALKEQRKEDPMRGMTAAEAYLEGFADGEHYFHGNRRSEFEEVGFGESYHEGYIAGETKRKAEADLHSR